MAEDSLPNTRAAAKVAGAEFYFTGVPCKHGHKAKRSTKDCQCVACRPAERRKRYLRNYERETANNRTWYVNNRDYALAYMREYAAKHKERVAETQKRCRQKHLAHHLARDRAYWHANKAKCTARLKLWVAANVERRREIARSWCRRNPVKRAMRSQFRYASKRARTPAWLSGEDLVAMQTFYELARRTTVESGIAYQVDHIVPLLGENVCGLHVPWNLQILTAEANRRKGNRLTE